MNQPSEEAGITVNELLSRAVQAEQQGVLVDWKNTCMQVANAATQYIALLESEKAQAREAMKEAE